MGIFHRTPYIGYNSAEQENPVLCVFLHFRNLPGLKLTWDFLGVNILPREAPGEEEVNETRPRGQASIGGAAPSQAVPPEPVWALSLQRR
jgi:hypothetical protein